MNYVTIFLLYNIFYLTISWLVESPQHTRDSSNHAIAKQQKLYCRNAHYLSDIYRKNPVFSSPRSPPHHHPQGGKKMDR